MKKNLLMLSMAAGFATPVHIQGLRSTADYGADERPKDFREAILWLSPNGDSPLTALMSKMGSESTIDPEFYWFEEEEQHIRLRTHGTEILAATGTLTVVAAGGPISAGAKACVPGDLFMVMNPKGIVGAEEIVLVTAVPANDTALVVARGAAGTTAANIPANSLLIKIGTAFGEGTLSARSASKNPTRLDNYTQIFKTSYELTNTDLATTKRTGDSEKNDKRRKMFNHATAMEHAYLFGRKFLDTDPENGKPRRFTQGLLRFIQTNKTEFIAPAGTPGAGQRRWTEDDFIEALEPAFNHKGDGFGDERIAFVGNGALTAINLLVANQGSKSSRINYDGIVEVYGMRLQRWIIPQGVIYLRSHPLFNNDPILRYSMVGVNPGALKDRYLRKTKTEDNIQTPGQDAKKGQWITESGLEVHHEKSMFYMANVGAKL